VHVLDSAHLETGDVVHEITVCTVVRNDDDPVDRWLRALDDQSASRAAFDVVVVDASPSAVVGRLAKEFSDTLRVTVVRADPASSPGAALNAGWRTASAAGVGFLSVHAVASRSWAEEAARALHRGRRAVSGRWLPTTESLPLAGKGSLGLWSTPYEAALVSTEQLACRHADLAGVGGFDEALDDPDRCDIDLVVRLIESGVDPHFSVRVIATYPVRQRDVNTMLAERRRAVRAVGALADRPRTRARLLFGGILWPGGPAESLLALTGLALGLRRRRYLLLAAPWLHERTCRTPRAGGSRRRWFVLPGVFAFDLYDAVVTTVERLRPKSGP
jgi:hypothetical protein